MLKYKFSYKGIQQTIASFTIIGSDVRIALENGMSKSAELLMQTAKSSGYVPVDTGRLRDSITMNFNSKNLEARVGPDMRSAPYAEWVEFGHYMKDGRWWPGSHYMGRAYRDTKDKMSQAVAIEVANRLEYYGRNIRAGRAIHKQTKRFVGAI